MTSYSPWSAKSSSSVLSFDPVDSIKGAAVVVSQLCWPVSLANKRESNAQDSSRAGSFLTCLCESSVENPPKKDFHILPCLSDPLPLHRGSRVILDHLKANMWWTARSSPFSCLVCIVSASPDLPVQPFSSKGLRESNLSSVLVSGKRL